MITNQMSIICYTAMRARHLVDWNICNYGYIKKQNVNAHCLHNLANINTIAYQLRTSKSEQPLHRTMRYGVKTLSNVWTHLLNPFLNNHDNITQFNVNEFNVFLKYMEGSGYFSCITWIQYYLYSRRKQSRQNADSSFIFNTVLLIAVRNYVTASYCPGAFAKKCWFGKIYRKPKFSGNLFACHFITLQVKIKYGCRYTSMPSSTSECDASNPAGEISSHGSSTQLPLL